MSYSIPNFEPACCPVFSSNCCFFFFFNFILFLNFTNCISFAKYQNKFTTGIQLLLLVLPTGFSGDREGGLVFPCLEEFSTYIICLTHFWSSLVAQTVKHLPTMWETRVQSLGWEDLLEKEMATHSSILAWKIPWMKKPGRLSPWGHRVGHD